MYAYAKGDNVDIPLGWNAWPPGTPLRQMGQGDGQLDVLFIAHPERTRPESDWSNDNIADSGSFRENRNGATHSVDANSATSSTERNVYDSETESAAEEGNSNAEGNLADSNRQPESD